MFIEKLRKSEKFKEFLNFYSDDMLKESDVVFEKLLEITLENLQMKLWDISICESPIEKLLLLSLQDKIGYNIQYGITSVINEQYEVNINGKKYRTDFCVNSINENGKAISVVVECDGHEFHEKNKFQAKRDKRRDRDFINAGYTVIRFTGSEIFEDVESCAWEVVHTISNLYENKGGVFSDN